MKSWNTGVVERWKGGEDDSSSAGRWAFWRHHLLVTSEGQARIYFNSGPYGHEQMYSLVADP